MVNCCSAALGFGGITHGDSDGEPTGDTSNGINRKCSRAKDGLGGVTHGVSNGETIGDANVGDVGQQDNIVAPAPQLASVALPLKMATAKLTAELTLTVMVSIASS
jgi:hypothetical protein